MVLMIQCDREQKLSNYGSVGILKQPTSGALNIVTFEAYWDRGKCAAI